MNVREELTNITDRRRVIPGALVGVEKPTFECF